MSEEKGYIKFNCIWKKEDFNFPERIYNSLNFWRDKLYVLKLIGVYANDIGYGNISMRSYNKTFIITGSGTGKKESLGRKDYTCVTDFHLNFNEVSCSGYTKASSEAMSHAALYESSPDIKAVIHIHHLPLWNALYNKVSTTDDSADYGTPEMAYELMRLCKNIDGKNEKILVMGGHKEGIITFGKDLDEAGEILLSYYHKYKL